MHPASDTRSKSIEPDSVLPQSAWPDVLAKTVVEVFSTMVGAAVTPMEAAPAGPMCLTGMVGIAGATRANFILRCSDEAASDLAAQMLGIPSDDPGSRKAAHDALGEVCNIVAGYFKAKVGLGEACKLSVPTIISGRDYCFHSRNTYDRLELSVAYEKHTLQAVLEIAR